MSSSTAPLVLVPSSINIDETFAVPHIVRPGETISSLSLTSRPGGKGANVSAALGLSGVETWFAGNVGSDATWPLDELKKRGVNVGLAGVLEGEKTGRAFIQISDEEGGENSIVLLKGANFPSTPSLTPDGVSSALPRPPTHLVLQNEIPLSTTSSFQSASRSLWPGCVAIWNPSPLPTREELRSWKWEELDVLIVNQGEARDLIAALGEDGKGDDGKGKEEKPEETMRRLSSLSSMAKLPWIVMTLGAHGVLASILSSSSGSAERTTISLPASKPRQVRDTTGAGDTFAGYLVSSVAQLGEKGLPKEREVIEKCLKRAGVAAAMAVEIKGAMESIPGEDRVKERLEGGEAQRV